HRRFFSLAELNGAIVELIEALNSRPMRLLGSSRRALFEATERSALLRLPTEPYVYAEWRRCRAGIDYHVEVYGHWYSGTVDARGGGDWPLHYRPGRTDPACQAAS